MKKIVKYVVKINGSNSIFIFHALPFKQQEITTFQWYIAKNINEQGEPIKKQEFESYTISGEQIMTNGYNGKYLYCGYINKKTGEYAKTEYIKLHSNVNEMILEGVIFDDISETDIQGNII
ncbi:hypothetical protein MZM54_00235 [[Brevibacterium] frigoritolerans]|nr:hypothetical protein [Peribacillus frigoritolerans]